MELYALPWDGVMAHPYDEDCQLCDRNVRSLITRQEFHDSNRGRSQGAIHFLKGNPDALTKEDVQKLNEASRINAEKDEAYWNGYWDGFIG